MKVKTRVKEGRAVRRGNALAAPDFVKGDQQMKIKTNVKAGPHGPPWVIR
jgi:hypothetical protein